MPFKNPLFILILTVVSLLACKKEQINNTSPANSHIIIIGSSIASGIGASVTKKSWSGLLAAKYAGTSFHNLSVPGYTTFHFLPDVFGELYKGYTITPDSSVNISHVIRMQPNLVIISITTNDIGYGYSTTEYMRNMKIITDSLQANKILYLVTSTTIRDDFAETNRKKLLSLAISLGKRYGQKFVDIMTPIADTSTLRINKEFYSSDLVHPNDNGHYLIYQRIDSVLRINYLLR